ncbi:uncharacterized protein UHOD_11220 [Ustilago sp. UG-2017b]|nr:uncharacterized protein UHOD_11220 [Ustilago sp. UG-2017b]
MRSSKLDKEVPSPPEEGGRSNAETSGKGGCTGRANNDKPGYGMPGFGEDDGSEERSGERNDVVKSGAEQNNAIAESSPDAHEAF